MLMRVWFIAVECVCVIDIGGDCVWLYGVWPLLFDLSGIADVHSCCCALITRVCGVCVCVLCRVVAVGVCGVSGLGCSICGTPLFWSLWEVLVIWGWPFSADKNALVLLLPGVGCCCGGACFCIGL